MPLNIEDARNRTDLLNQLQLIDISVPGRIDGRTSEHTETWVTARLLSTLAAHDLLEYPISVKHRDKPDALLESQGAQIGIEVTEAITSEYAAFCALRDREFPGKWIDPGYFRPGAGPFTPDQMRELLAQERLTSDGWVGETPEREWAQFMRGAILGKLEKLKKQGYAKFDNNWLAIYNNLPLPNVYLQRAVQLLVDQTSDIWLESPGFNLVFIEHGPVIVWLSRETSQHMVLHNLWGEF